ncbi:MAG: four helix bundle protein [Crocinitomicaceae bacterium]|nr:four helix bundle protein [Crocinitomicaceae bacterium]
MSYVKSTTADKSFEFAIDIIKTYKNLVFQKKEFVLSKQLLRSGTAVGALIREAQNAESKKDFIHKLGISQKECDESLYWIDLLMATEYITKESYNKLNRDCTQILKMIKRSIITAKSNL